MAEDVIDTYVSSLKHGDIIEVWSEVWREIQKVVFIKIDSDGSIIVRPTSWDSQTITIYGGEKYAHLIVSKDDVILPE